MLVNRSVSVENDKSRKNICRAFSIVPKGRSSKFKYPWARISGLNKKFVMAAAKVRKNKGLTERYMVFSPIPVKNRAKIEIDRITIKLNRVLTVKIMGTRMNNKNSFKPGETKCNNESPGLYPKHFNFFSTVHPLNFSP